MNNLVFLHLVINLTCPRVDLKEKGDCGQIHSSSSRDIQTFYFITSAIYSCITILSVHFSSCIMPHVMFNLFYLTQTAKKMATFID